jgi:hypothetical protein
VNVDRRPSPVFKEMEIRNMPENKKYVELIWHQKYDDLDIRYP